MVIGIVAALLCCRSARADVGVVLNEPIGSNVSKITATGHSAVYLSRICPASPVKLRLCAPGEQGSVLSTYANFGEDYDFQWNIVPLNIFVYGVENGQERPLFASAEVKHALEERYRERYLSAICAGPPCATNYKADWRNMVGAALERSIYIFVAATTLEQDEQFIADFNALPNESHFNFAFRNCADFTRNVVNSYFAHAARRDYINDFGMTSPKAVAHSFSRYALKHPETELRVMYFAQLTGSIKRGGTSRAGTEQLYHSKAWLVPMAFFASHELPIAAVSYMLIGRFNPLHEFQDHSSLEATELGYQIQAAKSADDDDRVKELKAKSEQARTALLGSSAQWKEYREMFSSLVDDAVSDESIASADAPGKFWNEFDKNGSLLVDDGGVLWMIVRDGDGVHQVGMNAGNLFAPGSDPHLAFELMLGRVNQILKSASQNRETMQEFTEDWKLLRRAQQKVTSLHQFRQPIVAGN